MVAGGDIPDVVEMPDRWAGIYKDRLVDLNDKIASWEYGGTLTQKTLDMGRQTDGKTARMIPYGFYLRAMFYNKKLLAEAGVENPPSTMAEFMDAAKAVSELDGKYGYCLRGGPGGLNGWIMMAATMNGDNTFFDADGKSTLNQPGSVEGIQFLIDMYQNGYAPKDSVSWASTRSWPASIREPVRSRSGPGCADRGCRAYGAGRLRCGSDACRSGRQGFPDHRFRRLGDVRHDQQRRPFLEADCASVQPGNQQGMGKARWRHSDP